MLSLNLVLGISVIPRPCSRMLLSAVETLALPIVAMQMYVLFGVHVFTTISAPEGHARGDVTFFTRLYLFSRARWR